MYAEGFCIEKLTEKKARMLVGEPKTVDAAKPQIKSVNSAIKYKKKCHKKLLELKKQLEARKVHRKMRRRTLTPKKRWTQEKAIEYVNDLIKTNELEIGHHNEKKNELQGTLKRLTAAA